MKSTPLDSTTCRISELEQENFKLMIENETLKRDNDRLNEKLTQKNSKYKKKVKPESINKLELTNVLTFD